MDINGKQISNTTFIIPFRRAAEFLDLKTCVSMMLVNKTINRGLSNNDFASIIVPKIMEVILIDNPANILEYFSFVFFPVADYRELLNAIQKATN